MTNSIRSFDKFFIGGRWQTPASTARIPIISPSTEATVASIPKATERDFDIAITMAREAFDSGPWPRMSPLERAKVISRVVPEIERRAEEIGTAFMHEVGGPAYMAQFMAQQARRMWEDAARLCAAFKFEEKRRGSPIGSKF